MIKFQINVKLQYFNTWGPLPVETRGTGPPNFCVGANNDFGPKFWEVYNNRNLVINEVFKKLTTKLASMKYYGNLVWYHLLNLLTKLLDSLLYYVYDYRIQSVAAPGGTAGTFPPNTNFVRAERMWINSRENFKFSLNFSKFLLKFS